MIRSTAGWIARIFLLALCLHRITTVQRVYCFTFSSISTAENFFPYPSDSQRNVDDSAKDIVLRIRSTKESDVHRGISDMWAWAVLDPQLGSSSTLGFVRRIQFLKAKSFVEDVMMARLNAIQVAERTMDACAIQYENVELSEPDKLRYLWSSERFRRTMERAAKLSNEPHIWTYHNFACAPKTMECLQHKMLTAEDLQTGELLGFCEIAMLLHPSSSTNDDNTFSSHEHNIVLRPTIVNLVVSEKHRRRGIASRIIRSAKNYVGQVWDADELNLYVDQTNTAAISLYRRLGFQDTAYSQQQQEEDKVVQLYMTLPLGSDSKCQSPEATAGFELSR